MVPQGYRLKFDLSELLEGGDESKEQRKKQEAKLRKRMEKYSSG